MWVFLSRRLRMWVLFAVGVPALSWALGKLGDGLERRGGPTTASRALKAGRDWLGRRARGPLARRRAGSAAADTPRADRTSPAEIGRPGRTGTV